MMARVSFVLLLGVDSFAVAVDPRARLTCGTQPSRTVRRTAAKAAGSLRKPS